MKHMKQVKIGFFSLFFLNFYFKNCLIKIQVLQENHQARQVDENLNDFDKNVVRQALIKMLTWYRNELITKIQRKSVQRSRLWKIRI
jgi:hypothetical protein